MIVKVFGQNLTFDYFFDQESINGLTIKSVSDIEKLQVHVFNSVEAQGDSLVFENDDIAFIFCHLQDCCESVSIEDIAGDLRDLVGVEIVEAKTNSNKSYNEDSSETYTFYDFRTINGSVTVRWYGTSNGYYSEGVSVFEITKMV